MEIRTELYRDDFKAFVRFVQRQGRSPASNSHPWRSRLALVGGWIILVVLFMVLFRYTDFRFDVRAVLSACFILLVFIVTFSVFFREIQNRLLPSENGIVLGHHDYRIDESGIHESTAHTESLTHWPAVRSLKETNAHFFIMLDTCVAHIVPKRSFPDPAEMDAFRHLVTGNLRQIPSEAESHGG